MSKARKPAFERYVGVDYSGAETIEASLKGLRVYRADRRRGPVEVPPPPGPKKYWTRQGLAGWLVERLAEDEATLVGIDHGFSFPMRYFEVHRLPPDWPTFLEDFVRHWPTHEKYTYVDFVRDGIRGDGAARTGSSRWRRLCDERAGAKSVFHFDVPGQVAKSTHAGLPWLLHLRRRLGKRVHFWPFDGWRITAGRPVVAEAYPSMFRKQFPRGDRTADQHDAYTIAAWMRHADADGRLADCFDPGLTPAEKTTAQVEGWILGLT
jgi:hypothetical protein